MGWLASLSSRALLWGAGLLLLTSLSTVAGAYWKGRVDGKAGCRTAQLEQTLTVERKATKARDAVRRTVPQGDNVSEILNWLDHYAVERY